MYNGGVLDNDKCGTNLDHGVLAIGYGVENDGTEYYIVKNSWGPTWGEDGFIKLAIHNDDEGMCGIQMQPSYPITN